MALTFLDIQNEIKRRGTRDQGGTQFDTAAKNLANSSLFRLTREALWKKLRRTDTFDTEGNLESGTVSATNDSKSMTGTSIDLITNNIQVGRRLDVQGSNLSYVIDTITGENAWTVNKVYDGTTAASLTYKIYGREEYNLPVQTGRVAFIWHEDFGYPFVLRYIPSMSFYDSSVPINTENTPTHYQMWGEDDIIEQPLEASTISISSSATADQSKPITIFGIVSGYPDFEEVNTNSSDGTTAVASTKSFTKVERISKGATTTGRITATSNSANVTVAVIPVGDATDTIMYKKIKLFPISGSIIPINVWMYKDPWRLVNDNDVHELGGDFDEAIILLSVAKIKYESSQKEGDRWMSMYKDELVGLKKTNAEKLDFLPTLKRPQPHASAGRLHPQVSFAQLGGAFGPMSFRP